MHWQETEQSLANAMINLLNYLYGYAWAESIFDLLIPNTSILLIIGTTVEIVGGALILLGTQVRLGAFLLALFLIPTTLFFHHFWFLQGSEKELQQIMFLKNLAIFGGALILMSYKANKRESK